MPLTISCWKLLGLLTQVGTSILVVEWVGNANFNRKGPIAGMFWHNEEYSMGLGKDIYLDGVVCLVDAVYGQRVGIFFVLLAPLKLTKFSAM